jgi:hypothetical protein
MDNDDDLTVSFVDALSGGDETTLDGIVSSHTNVETPTLEGMVIYAGSFGGSDGTPINSGVTKFKRIRSFIFRGTEFWNKTPVEVKVGTYIEGGVETGTIRLYDSTNDVVLGTVTTNSGSEGILEMVCTNWPADQATIEIQAKTTKQKTNVYCTAITILG